MRGYYGDLRHNVKAVYQFYLGAYDGKLANLNPCRPGVGETLPRIVGGADKAWPAAQAAFDKGDYRWAAELLNHAVFGDPSAKPPRTCWPAPTSRWATRPKPPPGATPT